MTPTSFFEVGERRISLKATLECLDGEDEAGRLQSGKDLKPQLQDKEDEAPRRRYPKEEEVEAVFPPTLE